mmetsp:Transcript_30708/g.84378  ORF Transcript_30708/g.84378 Transcript_30708/m.84378 type:complete len:102 (-) Transcript_30708:115-420(-)|eukprot:CAMPEP_0117537314 /NCGR_PEP_ID=MMETSP0784-20121206/41899_1 /TAXON_ID=39447 /ORGANISM="" /LENGTH=101 /DNA_ID=CAMNT_0005333893 /DNA_START=131 /DNA_END=436 /DNA_ORIENTATION=+
MGESMSRSCQACWDPEGTAKIVRQKKAQRAVLTKYTELFDKIDELTKSGAGITPMVQELRAYDREVQQKQDGAFYEDIQSHPEWGGIVKRRSELESKLGIA